MNTDRFKFRVFLREENRYAKETEYDELFWLCMDGRLFMDCGYDNPQYINYPDDKYKEGPRNIEDYVLEQCTGLKDANGKLIYEGDIVANVNNKFFIAYSDNEACFTVNLIGNSSEIQTCGCSDYWLKTKTIVGNIHENPELLKA